MFLFHVDQIKKQEQDFFLEVLTIMEMQQTTHKANKLFILIITSSHMYNFEEVFQYFFNRQVSKVLTFNLIYKETNNLQKNLLLNIFQKYNKTIKEFYV